MKYPKVIFFILFLIFINIFLLAEKSYNLNDLITLAEKNNLLLKIFEIERKITVEEYKTARVIPNPEFEFLSGRGQLTENTEKPSLWELGLKISIPNPIYRHFLLRSKKKTITESEIHAEIKKMRIIRNLKNHYFKYQFFKKIRSFVAEKLRILNEINKIIKAKVSIGEAKEIDNLRASVEIQKNSTYLFKIDKIISSEKTRINEFLNYILPLNFKLTEDFSFTPLINIEKRVKYLLEKTPFIALKLNKLELKREILKANKVSIIDSIDIIGKRGREMEGKVWKVGISIEIPIFNTKFSMIKKAKLEKEKAQTELERSKKHMYAEIQRKISEIRILEEEIKTFKGAILKEGKENVELSKKLYKEGEIPLIIFFDSQNSYFEIKKRFYEIITEWKTLKADLEELLGGEL